MVGRPASRGINVPALQINKEFTNLMSTLLSPDQHIRDVCLLQTNFKKIFMDNITVGKRW
jgi:hypothetical protein